MSVRTRRTAVLGAGVAVLALAGGVAAQFTASTTSLPQHIESAKVSIEFQNESSGWTSGSPNNVASGQSNELSQPVSNLAAGDTEIVTVDLVNTGSVDLTDSVWLSGVDEVSNGLTADLNGAETRDDSLQLNITSDLGTVYSGPATGLFGDGVKLPAGTLHLKSGERTTLTFNYTLPATASNSYQLKSALLTYTADATQRAGVTVKTN